MRFTHAPAIAKKTIFAALMAAMLLETPGLVPAVRSAVAEEADETAGSAEAVTTEEADNDAAIEDTAGESQESDEASSEEACEPLTADQLEATAVADEAADAASGKVTINRTNLSATPEYDTATYLEHFRIPVTHRESSVPPRDSPNDPVKLEWAFDDDYATRYIAGQTGPVTFTLGFDEVETFDRLIYKNNAFSTTEGYPRKLRVYTSLTGEEGSYEELTYLESGATAEKVVFNFSQPVTAKYVKLAFEQSQDDNRARASEFKFLRYDEVSAEVRDLFANADRTKLNDKYNSEDALRELEARANEHPIKESLLGYIDRAWKVFRGEIRDIKATRSNITINQGVDSEIYRAAFKVPVVNATSDRPGTNGNELAKAFDDNWDTRFVSNGYVGNYAITMEFDEVETIDRLLYRSGHSSQWNWGYPSGLTLSYSETGLEGSFTNVSLNSTSYTLSPVMFKLSEPVKAKVVKLIFTEMYGGFANFPVAASEIKVLRYDELPVILDDLFTDSSSLALKDKYNSEEVLNELQARLDVHPNKDQLADKLKRAWAVFRGEITNQNERLDWPVHVIQKTGPDTERINWLFYGEGYTYDQQDKFIKDITERVTKLMQVEPYRSMAPYMNLYAMCVESNESGVSTLTESKDTFFKVIYRGTIVASSSNGAGQRLNKWFTDNYLESGATLMHSTLLSNTNIYFGAGTEPSSASLAAGEMMVGHEAAHIFAGLADEYAIDSWKRGDQGGTNLTSNGDPETVRWKPFLGHRGATLVNMGGISNGRYSWKASGRCVMNSYNTREFCEICRESVFRRLNNNLKKEYQAPMYVAQPELTIVRTEEEKAAGTNTQWKGGSGREVREWDSGPVVSEANIASANGRALQYRTVVSNYRDTNQDVTLKLKITGADGAVKYEGEETTSVHPNTVIPDDMYPQDKIDGLQVFDTRQAGAVSLTITTPELTGLVAGDKIDASVWYDGKLMGTVGEPEWGTVRIAYKLVDDAGNVIGDVPGYGVQENRCYGGQNELGDVPSIYGYAYTGSSLDEEAFLAEAGKTSTIERYYKVTSAMVTKRLVDVNGVVIDEKSERVSSGETVTPQEGDFKANSLYRVIAPEPVVVGTKDIVLTYTYAAAGRPDVPEGIHNVALGKTASAVWAGSTSSAANATRVPGIAVDGVKNDTGKHAEFGANGNKNGSYLQVDFGELYDLKGEDGSLDDVVRLWRYWGDARTYNGTVIVASEGGTFAEGDREVLYNSDAENFHGFGTGSDPLYAETAAGLSVSLAKPVKARSIRVYMHGSNKNNPNHIVELEVFGEYATDDRPATLQRAIDKLQKVVESGLYTEDSATAARNAIKRALKLIYQEGLSDLTLQNAIASLESAEARLVLKDASEGSVRFLGGSLRYSDQVAEQVDGLRFGYEFTVPEGAEVDWAKTGWYYGAVGTVGTRLRAADKRVALGGNAYRANFVVTDIPAASYGTIVCVQAQLTYTLDGQERTIVSGVVNSRSVNGTAAKILAYDAATDRERAFAARIAG